MPSPAVFALYQPQKYGRGAYNKAKPPGADLFTIEEHQEYIPDCRQTRPSIPRKNLSTYAIWRSGYVTGKLVACSNPKRIINSGKASSFQQGKKGKSEKRVHFS